MRLRVFVSSTYYDLKHIRASLDAFIESMGYDSILSEKGDVTYSFDVPLDAACFREVETADIFVLIIGGSYGSPSPKDSIKDKGFYDRYNSITKGEYDAANRRGIPIYVLIESHVDAEYRTYLQNKENKDVKYAYVDSINVFHLIEEILSKSLNNPKHTFERFGDIQHWLREQWSGLFREMIRTKTDHGPLIALSAQIATLGEVTQTMQRYLESLMTQSSAPDSQRLIAEEHKRLKEAARERAKQLMKEYAEGVLRDVNDFVNNLETANTLMELSRGIGLPNLRWNDDFVKLLNDARLVLGRPPFSFYEKDEHGNPAVKSAPTYSHISDPLVLGAHLTALNAEKHALQKSVIKLRAEARERQME